jgi:flagellar biosynthesis chaperone FliJ
VKMPRYPLQTVLELRQRERDAAQEALSQAIAAEARERERLAALEEELRAGEAELAGKRGGLYDPPEKGTLDVALIDRRRAEIKFLEARQKKREAAVEEQRRVVAEAAEGVIAARQALTAAAQALTAIEKHQEKWREGVLAEMRRKEELQIQEIAASRYAAARREEESP